MVSELVSSLSPIGAFLRELDLSDPGVAKAALDRRFTDEIMEPITAALRAAHAEGTLTPREAGPAVRFGRVCKAVEATAHHSVDAVDIAGAGLPHGHPKGEVSWCMPLEGEPVFEGVPSGWAVLPPGSRHVPEVTGGRMLIVYFLPDGEVDWS